MKTFPGWRRAGHIMRWARQQDGVQVTVRRFPLPTNPRGYVVHTWTGGSLQSVTVGHDPIGGADITAVNGHARYDEVGMTADEALNILTQTGLLPLAVAEAVTR